MLSKKTYYALKALLYLGQHQATPERPVLIKNLIEDQQFPQKFLESILVSLKLCGIVNSKMGRGGGYYLAKPLDIIYLGTVIRHLEGPLALIPCASKTAFERCSHCADETRCSLRGVFLEVRDKTAELLDAMTLKELVEKEARLGANAQPQLEYSI